LLTHPGQEQTGCSARILPSVPLNCPL
jgi:hypothetical protein